VQSLTSSSEHSRKQHDTYYYSCGLWCFGGDFTRWIQLGGIVRSVTLHGSICPNSRPVLLILPARLVKSYNALRYLKRPNVFASVLDAPRDNRGGFCPSLKQFQISGYSSMFQPNWTLQPVPYDGSIWVLGEKDSWSNSRKHYLKTHRGHGFTLTQVKKTYHGDTANRFWSQIFDCIFPTSAGCTSSCCSASNRLRMSCGRSWFSINLRAYDFVSKSYAEDPEFETFYTKKILFKWEGIRAWMALKISPMSNSNSPEEASPSVETALCNNPVHFH